MGIKRDAADSWFSKCVRERTNYTCEYCHKQYDRSSTGLHCSHYWGRASKSVRWAGDNAFSHCYSCHQKLSANPHDFTYWVNKMLGDTRYEALLDKKNDTSIGKQLLKDNKAGLIAKHYKEQHKILTEKRQQGETLYIDFIDYY
ncbi:MAG TPA: hypothetical protein DCM10_15825 [Xanthomarina gelatinilytica]|nr:hypothetical protein [Xanthomarina gelatinilytica]